jgi:hypothetical protein
MPDARPVRGERAENFRRPRPLLSNAHDRVFRFVSGRSGSRALRKRFVPAKRCRKCYEVKAAGNFDPEPINADGARSLCNERL